MTIRIYKYTVDIPDIEHGKAAQTVLEIPGTARILTCGIQSGKLTFWAEFNLEEDYENLDRIIFIIPTGAPLPQFGPSYSNGTNWKLHYINTVFDGPFVWHIYEKYFFSGSMLA